MTLSFKLIMEGLSDCELLEKRLTPSDINSAKKFIEMADDAEKHLSHTLAQKFGVAHESVARMLKIYREKQQEKITMEDMNEGIPVFAYGSDIMTDIWSTLSKKKGSSTLTIPTKKTT